MGLPVVTVASGGLPVVESTVGGTPVTEATNGRGVAVTKVIGKPGLPVVFETIGAGTGVTYVTWDTATAALVTLSGGNLVVTNTGGAAGEQGARVAPASGKTSGKYYFELTVTTYGGGGNTSFGICTTASTYTNMGANATVGDSIFPSSATIYANGSVVGSIGTSLPNGTVVGIAVDLDNRKIWFRKTAGQWNSNGASANDPATNVGGLTIPAGTMVPVCTFNAAGSVFTANFGGSAFNGAVPSGFTAGWPVASPSVPVTWDPATVSNVTLSGGNLVATSTGTTSADQGAHVVGGSGKSTGMFYFEFTISASFAGGNVGIGVGTTASSYTSMGGSGTTGAICYVGSGNIWANGSFSTKTIAPRVNSNVIGCALDLTNGKIWFKLVSGTPGNWNGDVAANPATNTNGVTCPAGTMVPFVTFGGTSGVAGSAFTANFGASAFIGTPPSGFTAGWPA